MSIPDEPDLLCPSQDSGHLCVYSSSNKFGVCIHAYIFVLHQWAIFFFNSVSSGLYILCIVLLVYVSAKCSCLFCLVSVSSIFVWRICIYFFMFIFVHNFIEIMLVMDHKIYIYIQMYSCSLVVLVLIAVIFSFAIL